MKTMLIDEDDWTVVWLDMRWQYDDMMMMMNYKQPSSPPMPRHLILPPPWLKGNWHLANIVPPTNLPTSKFLPLPHFLWQTLFGVFLENVPQKKPSFVWMASRSHKLRYICYKAFAFARAELNLISKLCNFLQFQAQCMQARNISALQCSRRHLVDSNEMAAKKLDTKQHQKKITDAVLH